MHTRTLADSRFDDYMPLAPLQQKPALLDITRKPLRTQLALLVLAAVLPAFLASVWYLLSERDKARSVALEKVKILSDDTADRLLASLRVHEALLVQIAAQPRVQAMDPVNCDPAISDFVRLHREYVTLGTRDMQGNAVCTFRPDPPSARQVRSYPWFQQSLRAGKFYIGDVFFAPQARRWVVVLTMPIRDASGTQVGMVVLPLDLLTFDELVLAAVPKSAVVAVTDGQNKILMRSADPETWIGRDAPAAARDNKLSEGIASLTGVDGVRRVISFKKLPLGTWRVSAGVPENEVFAASDAALRNGVLGCAALLALALLAAWRLALGIARPLDALAATAERVAAGDSLARAPVRSGPPELAAVAAAFNHMLDARAQVQDALLRNEENLSITLQSIGDAVIATDAQGRVTRMNPVAERLTGWSVALATGRPLTEVFRIVNAQTREAVADPVQRVVDSGQEVGLANHTLLLSRDGREYQISDSAAPIRNASGQIVGVVLVFSDVTQQYAAQQALREAYNFSRQIVSSLPLGLNVRDVQGRYREWNPAMEKITGLNASEMLGRSMDESYPAQAPTAREAINAAIRRALLGELVVRPDLALDRGGKLQWTSGSHAPLRDTDGKIVGVISIVQDVTARRLAEQALRESQENLAITLQSIGDAVIATNAQGRITRMNAVAERLTGWPLVDALGLRLNEVFRIIDAGTRQLSQDPVQRVLQSGQVVGLANHTALLARDGAEYQISDSAAPIRDAAGLVVGVVLVFSDVSEQYRLQRVLVESEQRYRALVESSPVGVAMHRQGTLFYLNATAARTLGAGSAAELVGRPLLDFIHPDYYPLLQERSKVAQTSPAGTALPMAEWKYVRVDGEVIDVQAQATVVTLQGESAVHVNFLDITDRKKAERTLRDNEERFRALTQLSSDWYWEQDDQFRFLRLDGNLVGKIGLSNEGHIGRTRWELAELSLSPAEWEQHRATLKAHLEFHDFQMRRTDQQGQEFWVSVSGSPIFDGHGVFRGYRGIGRDITAQKLAQNQIHALAFYDALTELPNRRLLIEQLKKALLTHARTHRQAALLFIDLDNFKTLNDTLGHETGDLLLRQVAQRLLACVREADSVARLGGDEFVVMLEDLSADMAEAAVQAELVGQKILTAFGPPYVLGGREHRSTPSIGITLFGTGHQSVEDLLKQADLAMYQAKAAGRNTLRLFDERMQAAVDGQAALESDLREALAGGQMLLHYQPVVQADGSVTGAEALVRWRHPLRGEVPPGEFIGLAEANRLIIPLGQWVLDTACAQLAAWGRGPQTAQLTLAVNVSAHQFVEPDFVDQVVRALDNAGADPRKLKLELTESLLADNMEDVILKMTALRSRGVDFSLDDFGTGYSSLSYLKRLPLAQLKIDQSFVRDVLVDPNDAAIARTIVALGASLGLAVIAEGVETEGQYQFLLGIGCQAFQGYLFGRPVPIAEFEGFVRGPGKEGA